VNKIIASKRDLAVILAVGAFFLILPRFIGDYFLHLIIMIFFFGYLGSAWNILGGYAGQFSFGHAAFFGIGAFTSTLLYIHAGISPWIGIFLAGIAGILLGLLTGALSFRYGLRGPYFALVMLAFAEMLRVVAVEWMAVKYPMGIYMALKPDSFWDFQFKKSSYYYIIFFMLAVILFLTKAIEGKKIGSYFKAIRENENAADALGINTFRYKLLAMSISAFFTAIGGTFYAQYFLTIDSESAFGVGVSIEILLGPIIGGAGTVLGPLLGAGILEFLSEEIRDLIRGYSGLNLIIYGSILIAVIIFLPNGILGGFQKAFRSFQKRR